MPGNVLDQKPVRFFSWANLKKAVREPRKAASILLHRTLAPLGHRDYTRFIVLTRDRTGSNMLIQALNSHPHIAADYEIFGKLDGESEKAILDRCFGKQPFYVRAKGFKIFYYHPQDVDESTIWEILERMDDLRVIHLKRRNLLHAEVSSRIAYMTGIYGVRSEKEYSTYQEKLSPVEFSYVDLVRLFEQNRAWESSAIERFVEHSVMELVYEDMSAQFDSEYRRVLEFLEVSYKPPRIDFKKQRARSMKEALVDYDELKNRFTDTEWASFFEE